MNRSSILGPAEGFADGEGVLEWFDGARLKSRYEGRFVRGKLEGRARFEYFNGKPEDSSAGTAEYKAGRSHGWVFQSWNDGGHAHYFDVNETRVIGTMHYPDGAVFEGEFENETRKEGTLYYKGGGHFTGTYRANGNRWKGVEVNSAGRQSVGLFDETSGKLIEGARILPSRRDHGNFRGKHREQ